jgi:hypothetical protein
VNKTRLPILLSCLTLAACGGQTIEEKTAADSRAVAQVEAAQKLKPPIQPLELGKVNPTVRRLFKLSDSGCAFRNDPNPGAFPLIIMSPAKAVLLVNGEPAILAADSGSPQLTAGMHQKYVGRTLSAQMAQNPDRVTIRDSYERIVFQATGTLACRG